MFPIIRGDDEITLLVDGAIYDRTALLKTCCWVTDRSYTYSFTAMMSGSSPSFSERKRIKTI